MKPFHKSNDYGCERGLGALADELSSYNDSRRGLEADMVLWGLPKWLPPLRWGSL